MTELTMPRREWLQRVAGTAGVLGAGLGSATTAGAEPIHQSGETYFGAWTWESVSHTDAFASLFEQDIATIMEFDHWNVGRLRGVTGDASYYQDIVDAGYVPHIVWNGPNSTDGAGTWPAGTPSAAEYQGGGSREYQFCQDIVDGYQPVIDKLRAIARELAQVEGPVLWCPLEEANTNFRQPISTLEQYNGSAAWRDAWRRMYDIFQAEGATNLVWVLAPSGNQMRADGLGGTNGLDTWYPGDDYVDYVGSDFYDHGGGVWGDSGTPTEIVDDIIGQYDTVSDSGGGLPYIQNEIGSHSGAQGNRTSNPTFTQEEWTRRALQKLHDDDRVVGFTWWDGTNEGLGLTDASWTQEPTQFTSCGQAFKSKIDTLSFTASFDTGGSSGRQPYGGTPISLPGRIQAQYFDEGGQNTAYYDTTASNQGGAFRTDEAVDIQTVSDSATGGQYNVGWIEANEWLGYTVDVATAGEYELRARVASGSGGGAFHVEVDGTDLTGTVTVGDTGGWQSWTTVSLGTVSLSAGTHELSVAAESAGFNLNWIEAVYPGITDDCADLTELHADSDTGSLRVDTANQSYFRRADGNCSTDGARITRSGTTGTVSLVYQTGRAIDAVTVEGHTWASDPGTVTLYASTDWGSTWTQVSANRSEYCSPRSDWHHYEITPSSLPAGTNKVRIDLSGGTAWTPQIGHVEIE